MQATTRKRLRYAALAGAALLGAAALKLWLFPAQPANTYVTAAVTRADLEQSVLASGTIEAFKLVSVGAQASGQIKALHVKLGDTVKKGQLIAEIDSLTQQNTLRDKQAALQDVRAQLDAKRAALKQAQLAFARQRDMLAQDASSRADYESAEAALDADRADIAALEAQITQASIAVDTAKVNLAYTRITAPMDGVVVAVINEEGQTVNAAQTTPTIIKLAQLDKVTVKAEISEADITKVKPGMPVYFTILGEPDHRYRTTLRAIEPAPDSISDDSTTSSSSSSSSSSGSSSTSVAVYYNGLLDVPNSDGKLRISMTTQVNIVLASASDALSIPATALGARGPDGRYAVRVMDGAGRVSMRQVKIGIDNNVNAQVLEGLQAGERVVVGDAAAAAAASSQNQNSSRRGPPPMGM